MSMQRWIAYNLEGRRVGQYHPRAKFTDNEVQTVIDLKEEGYSITQISSIMEISKSTVSRWVSGASRGQPVAKWLFGGVYGGKENYA